MSKPINTGDFQKDMKNARGAWMKAWELGDGVNAKILEAYEAGAKFGVNWVNEGASKECDHEWISDKGWEEAACEKCEIQAKDLD